MFPNPEKSKSLLMEVRGRLQRAAVINITGTDICIFDFRCATIQVVLRMGMGLPYRPIEEAFKGVAILEQVSKQGRITAYLHPVGIGENPPLRTFTEFLMARGISLEQK